MGHEQASVCPSNPAHHTETPVMVAESFWQYRVMTLPPTSDHIADEDESRAPARDSADKTLSSTSTASGVHTGM